MAFGNALVLSLYGGVIEPKIRPTTPAASVPQSPAVEAVPEAPSNGDRAAADIVAEVRPARAGNIAVVDYGKAEAPQPMLPVIWPGPDWPQISPLDEAERLNQKRWEKIDKSALALSEPRREHDLGHLALVASKPCLICGRNHTHAHHLKFAQPTALGRKISVDFAVPFCSVHRRELHRHGDERIWWAVEGIDALKVAEELWASR